MKRLIFAIFSILILAAIITGCQWKEPTAKEIVLMGIEADRNIKQYSFNGTVDLHADNVQSDAENDLLSLLPLFSNSKIEIKGKEIVEPKRTEALVKITFSEADYTMEIPLLHKDERWLVKLPDILIPADPDRTKEYISFKEESKGSSLKEWVDHLDEDSFHKEERLDTPADEHIKQIVTVSVDQEDLNSIPNLPFLFTDFQRKATISQLKVSLYYDEQYYTRKIQINAKLILNSAEGKPIPLDMKIEENIENINEELPFEIPVPSEEQIMEFEELRENNSFYIGYTK